jgi:hypothetical protein
MNRSLIGFRQILGCDNGTTRISLLARLSRGAERRRTQAHGATVSLARVRSAQGFAPCPSVRKICSGARDPSSLRTGSQLPPALWTFSRKDGLHHCIYPVKESILYARGPCQWEISIINKYLTPSFASLFVKKPKKVKKALCKKVFDIPKKTVYSVFNRITSQTCD